MHGRADFRIGIRIHLDRPVVGTDDHRILFRQPLRSGDTNTRVCLYIADVVFPPQLAPARIDDHGIAGLQREILAFESRLQVLNGDFVGIRQHLDALESSHVEQHASSHQRADFFDAELRETGPAGDLVLLEAVVKAVVDPLMAEAVKGSTTAFTTASSRTRSPAGPVSRSSASKKSAR